MSFKIVEEITNIETIVVASSFRKIGRLRKVYGAGRWKKLKGRAQRFVFSTARYARLRYIRYGAHGIGKKEIKIKRNWLSYCLHQKIVLVKICFERR